MWANISLLWVALSKYPSTNRCKCWSKNRWIKTYKNMYIHTKNGIIGPAAEINLGLYQMVTKIVLVKFSLVGQSEKLTVKMVKKITPWPKILNTLQSLLVPINISHSKWRNLLVWAAKYRREHKNPLSLNQVQNELKAPQQGQPLRFYWDTIPTSKQQKLKHPNPPWFGLNSLKSHAINKQHENITTRLTPIPTHPYKLTSKTINIFVR